MSDSVIGINTAGVGLKKVWKQAKEVIDKLGPDYYVDEFIFRQCLKRFHASYKEQHGSRCMRSKCVLRTLQSVCSLEKRFPFQPGKVTLERIRKENFRKFRKDYGLESTFLALLILEDKALILPGSDFYTTQQFGRQVVSVLKRLAKSEPEKYGMYVRESQSQTIAPKTQEVPNLSLAT